MSLLKKIYLQVFCNWFVRVSHIGKKSYICNKRIIQNGKYISIGDNTKIQSNSRLCCFTKYENYEYEPKVIIKNNVNIQYNVTILSAGTVEIGNNVLIASNVFITNENHHFDVSDIPFVKQKLDVKDVIIGDNCFLGEKSVILPGVNLGKYVVVAAGSVVTKSVPDYSMIAGNPARIIKVFNLKTNEWESVKEIKHV